MTESFEDRFNHDPTGEREIELEEDLGRDEEYTDIEEKSAPKPQPETLQKQRSGKTTELPKRGCFFGLFKVFISFCLIAACYTYIFQPEKMASVEKKVKTFVDNFVSTKDEPKLFADKKVSETKQQKKIDVSFIELKGNASLVDFSIAAKRNPNLYKYLVPFVILETKDLNTYHTHLEHLIFAWTNSTSKTVIEETTKLPYSDFYQRTSASLLSQTVLKKFGLVSVQNSNLIAQDPVQAMAVIYHPLKTLIAPQVTPRQKLKIAEPISSFFLYRCKGNFECLASWDLFIEMIGLREFADILEKTPEKIYEE